MNKKQMAMIFAAAICACVLSIGIVVAADESESDTQEQPSYIDNPGEIGDIARKAEAKVEEVNEAFLSEKEQLQTVKREQYFEDYKEETSKNLLSDDDIAALENERAKNEKAIRTKADYEIQSLETEPAPTQMVSPAAPVSRRAAPASGSSRGMVKGIVFYDEKGAALIDGEVVRENDVVMNVKIIRILPEYVEFEKQSNKWKQQVGQFPPPSAWEQPQQSSPVRQSSTDTKPKK
jgi:hypothetical protein